MQHHRREDHAGDAHESFADHQSEQHQPDGGLDFGPDDFAGQEVAQFVDQHQKYQGPQAFGRRDHEPQRHDQRVADQIADDRNEAAEKGEPDGDDQMLQAHNLHENSGQNSVDGRDGDLGIRHHGEAEVKGGETAADFFAAERIQVLAGGAGGGIQFQRRLEIQTNGHNHTDEQVNELRRGAARDIGKGAEVVGLAAREFERLFLQAFQVGEGQPNLMVGGPLHNGRQGAVGDVRQIPDRGVNKIGKRVGDPGQQHQEDGHGQPFRARLHEIQLRDDVIGEQNREQERAQVKPSCQYQNQQEKTKGNAAGLAHAGGNVALCCRNSQLPNPPMATGL